MLGANKEMRSCYVILVVVLANCTTDQKDQPKEITDQPVINQFLSNKWVKLDEPYTRIEFKGDIIQVSFPKNRNELASTKAYPFQLVKDSVVFTVGNPPLKCNYKVRSIINDTLTLTVVIDPLRLEDTEQYKRIKR
jgi:hypothetical protein